MVICTLPTQSHSVATACDEQRDDKRIKRFFVVVVFNMAGACGLSALHQASLNDIPVIKKNLRLLEQALGKKVLNEF